ncbi:MAG: hypothetical protein LH606_21535, partial [Cytophagaceae bacterium]|nr:hypothetical protein [Cytophagaceae bacterium]
MKKPLTVFTLLFSLLSFGAFAQNTLVIRPDNTDFLMSVPPSNPFNSVNNAIKYRVYVVNSTFPSGTLAPLGNCKVTFVSTNGFVPPNTTYSNLD